MWKWKYFAVSSFVAACVLVRFGVPFIAVLAGIGGVAMFMRKRAARLS